MPEPVPTEIYISAIIGEVERTIRSVEGGSTGGSYEYVDGYIDALNGVLDWVQEVIRNAE